MGFRPDEAAEIKVRLQRSRPDLLTDGWEDRLSATEKAVALTAWRQWPLEVRVRALLDWLSIFEPLTFPIRYRKWGDGTA